jgi:macrolide-specific efflux system membrane fusion protein
MANKPRVKWSRTRKLVVSAVSLLAVVAIGLSVFFATRPKAATTTSFSQTVKATKTTQTVSVSMTGTLAPQIESDLSFPVSGQVTAVNTTVGATVKAGDALATIDDTSLRNAVSLANANLTSAQANYTQVSGLSTSTSAQITAAKAQVTSANANLATAQTNLKNATLRSPIAGTVASVGMTVGQQVSAGGGGSAGGTSGSSSASSAQIVVIATSLWKVNASVGSADLANLKVGQAATVTVTGSNAALKGTVASIGIVAVTSSGGSSSYPVVVDLTDPSTTLYSGTNVNVTVVAASYPDVLVVPTAAISTQNGQAIVQLSKDGGTVATPVKVGRVFGTTTEILSGLNDGDSVVITITRAIPTGISTRGANGGFGNGDFPAGGGDFGGGAPPGGVAPAAGTGTGAR